MWLLNFIPDWVIHLSTLAGILVLVLSIVLSFIPFIDRYRLPLQVLGTVVVCMGLFFEGMLYCNSMWDERVVELERKIAAAQVAAAETNTKIVTKYITKVEKVKEKTNDNIKYIETYVTRDDALCTVPNSVIVLHDSASKNEVPPGPGGAYEGASDVKISELTTTVVENYGTYYQISEQLKAWQEWYRTQKDIFEKAFN